MNDNSPLRITNVPRTLGKWLGGPPMIDLRRLQMFVAAYDARSYTAAAHRLGYTRQNIAYGISQLGRQAGGPLFANVGRNGVRPTTCAEHIIQAARQAVEAAEVCQRVLSDANSKKHLT